jgi:hypothetical protein
MTIPASKLVRVNPGVITAGGAALTLSGLILTAATAIPLGTVYQFSTPAAVSAFFGPTSAESIAANIYFAGYDNSTAKPGNVLFSQYPTASVAAYLRSGSFANVTLAQLNAITPGILTITVDGVVKTSSSINLAAATSFSNAATLIAAAFTGGPTVTFDSLRQAFVFTSTTTGATSTITFGSGAISAALLTTSATGAVLSQGSIAYTPAAAMVSITNATLNWAAFMTIFEPILADKIAFGTWTSQQNNRFVYAGWDTDPNAVVSGNTSAFGPQVNSLALSGSVPLTADPARAAALGVTAASIAQPLAAFVLGAIASVDFGRTNGRVTFAFRSQGGIVAGVADATVADILDANGYNFYGEYATSSQQFRFLQPGSVGGPFAWLDSYINQIWLNASLQTALMNLLANSGSVPYNPDGFSLIDAACAGPITSAVNFGAIRTNVQLSASQIAAVNASAGVKIDTVLSSRGWYLQIKDPGATVRAARGTPIITLYYMDGGSIQTITMASILVQ